MSDEVPSLLKGVYIFIEMLALGGVLKAYDEFEKQHYLWGAFFIILGAVFLFSGLAGLNGWLKKEKSHSSANEVQPEPHEAEAKRALRLPRIMIHPWPSPLDWIFIAISSLLLARAAFVIYRLAHATPPTFSVANLPYQNLSPASPSPSHSEDLGVYHLSKITPEYIASQIAAAPPLQQQEIADGYVGAPVRWRLYLFEASKSESNPSFIKVMLLSTPTASADEVDVLAGVNADGNEFLKLSKAGDEFIVSGTIGHILPFGPMFLKGASLNPVH